MTRSTRKKRWRANNSFSHARQGTFDGFAGSYPEPISAVVSLTGTEAVYVVSNARPRVVKKDGKIRWQRCSIASRFQHPSCAFSMRFQADKFAAAADKITLARHVASSQNTVRGYLGSCFRGTTDKRPAHDSSLAFESGGKAIARKEVVHWNISVLASEVALPNGSRRAVRPAATASYGSPHPITRKPARPSL